jgi:hypothetical protein
MVSQPSGMYPLGKDERRKRKTGSSKLQGGVRDVTSNCARFESHSVNYRLLCFTAGLQTHTAVTARSFPILAVHCSLSYNHPKRQIVSLSKPPICWHSGSPWRSWTGNVMSARDWCFFRTSCWRCQPICRGASNATAGNRRGTCSSPVFYSCKKPVSG